MNRPAPGVGDSLTDVLASARYVKALEIAEQAGHLRLRTAYQARENAARARLLARIAASLASELESSRARALADARLRQVEHLWREQQKASHPFEHPSAQG